MDHAQRVTAKIALAVLAADGFLLAGGQALIEHGITERPSDDIDLFALHRQHTPATFAASVQKMTAALKTAGYTVEITRQYEEFASFAPSAVVHAQLRTKTTKLLQGVASNTFTVNTRTTVKLSDVELIVKDLLRKQDLARKHDPSLSKNRIVGLLKKPRATVQEDAEALIKAIGLEREAIRQARNKETALELIIEQLEANQVLVSRSVRGFMPQLIEVHFSGMTVRDSKAPYIFLTGGDHGDFQEPAGRQIFTLVLMAVLVARGIFAPVSYDANSTAPEAGREYDIVGEILMPAADLQGMTLKELGGVKAAADLFKVTPSAVAVRAMRLGRLTPLTANGYLRELKEEFLTGQKPKPRQPKPVNAIKKYSGRALTTRMLRAVDERRLSRREFCRVVCLNRIGPSDLGELKAALR